MHRRSARVRATQLFILQFMLLLGISGHAWAQAIPGKNVDMVGPTPPNTGHAGNVLMQQNEVAGANSVWKPNVQYGAWNDYRLVYEPGGGDAVIGFGYSTDGGRTWFSFAHPGFSIDDPTLPSGGADPNIVVLPGVDGGGVVLVNHMAFTRDTDLGELRTGIWYEHNRDVGPPVSFLMNSTNETGSSGLFHDKPSFEGMVRDPSGGGHPDIIIPIPPFDGPEGSGASHGGYDLHIQAARLHTCFTKFTGNSNDTKVECQYSDDAGINWSHAQKLSEGSETLQGTTIVLQDFGRIVNVFWARFEDNNETAAIIVAKSQDHGVTFAPWEVVTEFCPYNAGTGPARFRSNALPVAVASGDEPDDVAVFFASRNDALETCATQPKGKGKNKTPTPNMHQVRTKDDFDGARDGQIRASRNFSRIMMVRQKSDESGWELPVMVDPQEWTTADDLTDPDDNPECLTGDHCRKNFHQIMPACEAGGGIITCSWFDTRLDRLNNLASPITSAFIEDAILHLVDAYPSPEGNGTFDDGDKWSVFPSSLYGLVPPPTDVHGNPPPTDNNFPLRRNLDTFAAQIDLTLATPTFAGTRPYTVDQITWYPDAGGVPSDSVRVSRFATRQKPGANPGVREQVAFNFGGARLFQKGRAAFMSDYNGVWTLSAIQ